MGTVSTGAGAVRIPLLSGYAKSPKPLGKPVTQTPETTPPLPPEPQTAAKLERHLHEADVDTAAAWRANEALQAECEAWKKRAMAEMERAEEVTKTFSWWLTIPVRELDRMQARLRRSLAKRMTNQPRPRNWRRIPWRKMAGLRPRVWCLLRRVSCKGPV
jgi:hypothetical protein